MSYLPIMSPFSLDKVGSDTSPHPTGIFSEFKNYIPNKHVIETRKGISEFFFSGGVYNPADDPDCVMWLRMESTGTLGNCEINGNNYMDKVGTPSASASYMEGSGSMHTDAFTGSGNYLRRANTALRTDFPGVGSRNFMICFWVNIDWGGDHIYFTNKAPEGQPGAINLRSITAAVSGIKLQFSIENDGGDPTFVYSTAKVNTEKWYHIGLWNSQDLSTCGMRLYRYTDGPYAEHNTHTGTWYGLGLKSDTDYFEIGYDNCRAEIDDYIVLKGVPATQADIIAKIDSIRNRVL